MKTIIHKMKKLLLSKQAELPVEAGFACPICGATHIHSHTSGEIVEHLNKQKAQANAASQAKRKPAPKKELPGDVKVSPPKRKRPPRNHQNGR